MGKRLAVPEPESGLAFVDTHCHVPWDDATFETKLPSPDDQLATFHAAGGLFIITATIDLETSRRALEFRREHEHVHAALGMAPQTITFTPPDEYETKLEAWYSLVDANLDNILTIGEIGVDFHHGKKLDQRERQINEFRGILRHVADLNRPIMLHVRNAGQNDQDFSNPSHVYNNPDRATRTVVDVLGEVGISPHRVLFHCYSGPSSMNDELARAGFWFSVPSSAWGIEKWNRVSKTLPLDHLVTETDAPFQHPWLMEPANEPANARYAVAAIAHARGLTQDEVARATIENAKRFFNLP
jgi:TatD DNase family protein